ncbi:ribonuclease H family protein [Vibrio parahaemolyticus]|uniref:ribonuclease H family protein n=1 Tax=Vibrio parahaemolyticus TaxID=670 RepID=UPI001E341563|nr:ribonuclease H family protein [Vibrio parahaemolyticus]ELB2044567.1 ribonuclease H family protein [Vibrio parahaemolyticus]
MSKKSKAKSHVVAQGHQPGVYINWGDVQKQISGYKGKVNWGCESVEQAEAEYQALSAWRCLSPENRTEKLTLEKAKEIVAGMLANSEEFIAECAESKELKVAVNESVPKFYKLVLTCYFGGKNADSTITSSDGKSEVVKLSSGATAKLKYLELTHAAIKYADNAINGGVDCVEVWGVDGSVLVTLNEWAPKYRECGWVNSYGKPVANRDVIEPMLALYEKLGDKVKLNTGEQPVDNDVPF